jgi:acetyl-CoA acetyltransferase
MQFVEAFIPYGGYWSTPFSRWQGSFAHLHSMTFAADITRRALEERHLEASAFDALHLGLTVPQPHSFYGAPWLAGMIGAQGITGPTLSQACATSARVLASAAMAVDTDEAETVLTITCDRTSNGPHLYYPNPLGPGGRGDAEDWVWDNFSFDPYAKNAMIETAENVAEEGEISREEQDRVTLMRYEQYQKALADDSAFLRRFMVAPLEVRDTAGRKVVATVTGDEGVFPTTQDGLARLKPVKEGGTVTFGSQTHPADGNCGLIVTRAEKAREMSRDPGIEVQLLSFGQARAKPGFMAQATVPAARRALEAAGLTLDEMKAIKTHNPFAVNDIYFCRETGVPAEALNNYGCSLIWGHPQGPTGMRLVMELIEELVIKGGGYGLFTGCAAGDTAAAVVLRVTEAG